MRDVGNVMHGLPFTGKRKKKEKKKDLQWTGRREGEGGTKLILIFCDLFYYTLAKILSLCLLSFIKKGIK